MGGDHGGRAACRSGRRRARPSMSSVASRGFADEHQLRLRVAVGETPVCLGRALQARSLRSDREPHAIRRGVRMSLTASPRRPIARPRSGARGADEIARPSLPSPPCGGGSGRGVFFDPKANPPSGSLRDPTSPARGEVEEVAARVVSSAKRSTGSSPTAASAPALHIEGEQIRGRPWVWSGGMDRIILACFHARSSSALWQN